jgi:hypothetical protein
LGYAEYGSPQDKLLFYFHGWPSSRVEFAGLNGDAIATKHLHMLVYHFELTPSQGCSENPKKNQ